ncbi:hypothetical protein HaLaN_26455, partial [Haematococcus lacustris]
MSSTLPHPSPNPISLHHTLHSTNGNHHYQHLLFPFPFPIHPHPPNPSTQVNAIRQRNPSTQSVKAVRNPVSPYPSGQLGAGSLEPALEVAANTTLTSHANERTHRLVEAWVRAIAITVQERDDDGRAGREEG